MHTAMAAPLTAAAAAPYVARSLSLALRTCLRSATAFIFNRAKEELAAAAAAAAVVSAVAAVTAAAATTAAALAVAAAAEAAVTAVVE